MADLVHISTTEIDVLAHWLGADIDEHGCSSAWLVPLHELDVDVDASGYVLFAPEVHAGGR